MAAPKQVNAGAFSPDIRDFMRCLQKHGVRHMIVGGNAVIFHGFIRYTGDIDFFYEDTAENRLALWTALRDFWGGTVAEVSSPDDLASPGAVLQFGRPPNRIDLLNRIEGVSFEDAWPRRVEARLCDEEGELTLHYLGKEELLANKRAVGRRRDLDDCDALG
ncbi:MAG: nucleotidyl transferase AbiEii/AbiGii toxin family protein [Chthoniobacterales bacterium]|nr:nucleotidyl transferase AbiEii/AbiGii toxin family protein [Chthoniobacterales bacterium]